jgi:metal-responsive CopG/Arc/MetJ family transcriptional regulator
MKTIQMTIDARLLKAIDKLTKLRKTSRSAFIRAAVEAELRRERIRELTELILTTADGLPQICAVNF